MIYTLLDARKAVAQYVSGGRASTDSSVLTAVNEALEILIDEGDWKHTVLKLIIKVKNGCIALPRGAETILKANYCRTPMNVWTHGWEFLSSGPGSMDFGGDTNYKDVADLGWHPTFYPLGGLSLKLLALSTEAEDKSLSLQVWGRAGSLNEDVFDNVASATSGGSGETLAIDQWINGIDGDIDQTTSLVARSTPDYRGITRITKPITKGYITLLGIDSSNNVGFLAKYSPDETVPQYRRYRVTGRGN